MKTFRTGRDPSAAAGGEGVSGPVQEKRVRLKFRAHIEMGQSPPSSEYSTAPADGLPFLQGTADFGVMSPTPQVYCGSPTKVARSGDILFSVRAPVGELNVADQEYGIGRGLCAIRPHAGWHRRFAWWALHEARPQLGFVSTGSTYEAVATEDVGNLSVEVATPGAQRAIADYLDRETARIDALIAAKERVLALLAEKRRALITRAVTRGLDPNAPLRDSGIPWLGEIPAHWELKRLKHVGRAIIGLTFDPANTVTDGSGVLVLRASNVRDQRIVLEDNLYVSMEIPDDLRTREGDILICSRSGSRALIGKNALIDSASAGLSFGAFMTVFRSPHNAFLFYVFNSPLFDYQAGAFSTSTINQLTVETLNGMEVPLPPQPEQEAIVAWLRQKISGLHAAAVAIDRSLALLRERRSALIAAAVTGQIDVGETSDSDTEHQNNIGEKP